MALRNPNIVEDGRATRFTSENAKGRPPNVGRTIKEFMNDIAALKPSRAQVQAIAADESEDHFRRLAAEKCLDPKEMWMICDQTDARPATTSINQTEVVHVRQTIIHTNEPARN